MNWKEELMNDFIPIEYVDKIETFIQTQIIEKLIEDIPTESPYPMSTKERQQLKQQLRDKWL